MAKAAEKTKTKPPAKKKGGEDPELVGPNGQLAIPGTTSKRDHRIHKLALDHVRAVRHARKSIEQRNVLHDELVAVMRDRKISYYSVDGITVTVEQTPKAKVVETEKPKKPGDGETA